MPSKRYRLKLDHPYAKAGTIVEEDEYQSPNPAVLALQIRDGMLNGVVRDIALSIPYAVLDAWLEEVKEDVTFTNAQKEAIMDKLDEHYPPHVGELKVWLSQHTSKEE